jgi:hypothetical protein
VPVELDGTIRIGVKLDGSEWTVSFIIGGFKFDRLNMNLIFKYKFDHFLSFEVKKFGKKSFKNKFRTPFTYKYRLRSKKIKCSCLFYVSYFKFLYNYFLNFIVQKINSKMVKSRMVVQLRERNPILMNYSLDVESTVKTVVAERERELV